MPPVSGLVPNTGGVQEEEIDWDKLLDETLEEVRAAESIARGELGEALARMDDERSLEEDSEAERILGEVLQEMGLSRDGPSTAELPQPFKFPNPQEIHQLFLRWVVLYKENPGETRRMIEEKFSVAKGVVASFILIDRAETQSF